MDVGEHDRKVLLTFAENKMGSVMNALDDAWDEAVGISQRYAPGGIRQGWEQASEFLRKLLREADSLSVAIREAGRERDRTDTSADDFITGHPYQGR